MDGAVHVRGRERQCPRGSGYQPGKEQAHFTCRNKSVRRARAYLSNTAFGSTGGSHINNLALLPSGPPVLFPF
jgi:hypothetical protein